MKKKIALLTTGWSYEYLLSVTSGLREELENENVDLYVFLCYGYRGEPGPFNHGEYNIYNLINFNDYDGVIILSNIFNSPEVLERQRKRILESGIPAVSLEYQIEGVDFIGTDNYSGMHDIVRHLVTVHKASNFAYIGGPDTNFESQARLKAFRETLQELGIQSDESRIITGGNWSYKFGYSQTLELIKDRNNLPEVIVCVNDETALASLTALFDSGIKVPEQIKVTGFDDINLADSFNPSLTTVNRTWKTLGKTCARHLMNKIAGLPVEPYTLLSSKAVIRRSCGCPETDSLKQQSYCMKSFYSNRETLAFNTQLRQMEEVFMENDKPELLCSKLQKFFEKNHTFEDSDMCAVIIDDFIPGEEDDTDERKITGYNQQMKVLFNISSSPSANQTPETGLVSSKNIIPFSMMNNSSNEYVIVPLHYHHYVHGYMVLQNSEKLLKNRFCYSWKNNLSNSLEKFRQKQIYKLMNRKLERLSMKDSMTGLLNRLGYHQLVYSLFDDNKRNGKTSYIVFIDINFMKKINDNYGHLYGDLSIKTVSEIILMNLSEGDLAVRYGGDEFVLIGTEDNSEIVRDFCAEITSQVADKSKALNLPFDLTVSTGFGLFPPKTELDLDKAVSLVDEIMYENKARNHMERRD